MASYRMLPVAATHGEVVLQLLRKNVNSPVLRVNYNFFERYQKLCLHDDFVHDNVKVRNVYNARNFVLQDDKQRSSDYNRRENANGRVLKGSIQRRAATHFDRP